jgi:hypothetical protein
VKNIEAAEFAQRTGFVSPIFGIGNHTTVFKSIDDQIRQNIGRAPRSYAEVAYDAFWLASLTENKVNGQSDINLLKSTFLQLANSHVGITGNTSLNEAGDRKYGDYDFWAVVASDSNGDHGGNFEWKLVGKFQSNTGNYYTGFGLSRQNENNFIKSVSFSKEQIKLQLPHFIR